MPNTIHIASPAKTKTRKPKATKTVPTLEEIRIRAYHIYVGRNGAPGNAFDDWAQAESELIAMSGKPSTETKTQKAGASEKVLKANSSAVESAGVPARPKSRLAG